MSAYCETWTRLHELKAARSADLLAFLGAKAANGANWDGKLINEVRGLAASLATNPPGNLASQDDVRMHTKCLDLARDLSNG